MTNILKACSSLTKPVVENLKTRFGLQPAPKDFLVYDLTSKGFQKLIDKMPQNAQAFRKMLRAYGDVIPLEFPRLLGYQEDLLNQFGLEMIKDRLAARNILETISKINQFHKSRGQKGERFGVPVIESSYSLQQFALTEGVDYAKKYPDFPLMSEDELEMRADRLVAQRQVSQIF